MHATMINAKCFQLCNEQLESVHHPGNVKVCRTHKLIIIIIINTYLKRSIPQLVTYMRLKVQYMFIKNQAKIKTKKPTSDIKKKPGKGG